MDGGSIERLELRQGEPVNAAHVAQLDRAIVRNTGLPGARVRRRVWPWGTAHSYHGGSGGAASSPVFQPEVALLDADSAEIRWGGPRALIGGVAPTIDDVEIFTEDAETGLRPALLVKRESFTAAGECGVYFRVEVDAGDNFRAQKITPVALPPPPPTLPFIAHKLALHLRLRAGVVSYVEEDDRALFFALGFFAVERRASGVFEPIFSV